MRQGGLAVVRQVVVVEDEVEKHAHQVDHVGLLVGQLLLAGEAAVAFQLLLQVGFQAFHCLWLVQALTEVVGRLLLQAIECIEQFVGAVGACRIARSKAGDTAGAAQQGRIDIVLTVFTQ